jgi:hypothetical protein
MMHRLFKHALQYADGRGLLVSLIRPGHVKYNERLKQDVVSDSFGGRCIIRYQTHRGLASWLRLRPLCLLVSR